MIQLTRVLDLMSKLESFDLTVVTADENTNTGGDIIEYKAVKLSNKERSGENSTGGATQIKKRQNHYDNSTRNLILPNGEIRKIHIRLITRFNSQPVIY